MFVGKFSITAVTVLAIVFGTAPSAHAEVKTAPFLTEHEQQVLGFEDFDFDSGWVPGSSPIQVRLTAHAGNTVYISMDGDAHYDWEIDSVAFEGRPDGGLLEFDLGIETSAQVMFDILGYTWTGDLMDPILYGVFEELVFDPYLLLNHPDRPAVLDTDLPRQDGVEIPLGVDLIVASGHIAIDIGGHIRAELRGEYIDVWEAESPENVVSVTEHEQWGRLVAPSREDPFVAMAQLGVHLQVDLTFLLYPSVVVTLLGTDYPLAEIEVPVPAPTVNQNYAFEPVEIAFDPPASEGDDDDDDDLGPGAGQGDDDGTVNVAACDCATVGHSTPTVASMLWLLGLLGIGGWRRKR
jgi:MYXO-CTERM domain-containing protein